MRQRHACQRLGRVCEDSEPRSGGREGTQSRTRVAVRAEKDWRPILSEALEGGAPVPDPGGGPAVQFIRGGAAVGGE